MVSLNKRVTKEGLLSWIYMLLPKRTLFVVGMLAILIVLDGCSCCLTIPKPIFRGCRRPPVVTTWEDCVLDYCPEDSCCREEQCKNCSKGYLSTDCSGCSSKVCDTCFTSGCSACGTSGCDLCGSHCCDTCCSGGCSTCGRGGALSPEDFNPYAPWEVEYTIQVGDTLEISVYGDDETYVENVVVAPDGYLYYTLLKGFYVDGLSIDQLRENLTNQLSKLFISPVVTVTPSVLGARDFKVLGRVHKPGNYPLVAPLTLRQAIAQAGGIIIEEYKGEYRERRGRRGGRSGGGRTYNTQLYSLADLKNSFVARDQRKLSVDFESLLTSGDDTQNIYMRPGDYIYIAPAKSQYVYVLGGVYDPQMLPFHNGMTLMSTFASVGGWLPGANAYTPDLSRVLIIRGSLECPCYIQVDIKKILRGEARDVCLKAGDILYAQNKKFRFGRELVRLAIDTFINSFVTSAAAHLADVHWFNISEPTEE